MKIGRVNTFIVSIGIFIMMALAPASYGGKDQLLFRHHPTLSIEVLRAIETGGYLPNTIVEPLQQGKKASPARRCRDGFTWLLNGYGKDDKHLPELTLNAALEDAEQQARKGHPKALQLMQALDHPEFQQTEVSWSRSVLNAVTNPVRSFIHSTRENKKQRLARLSGNPANITPHSLYTPIQTHSGKESATSSSKTSKMVAAGLAALVMAQGVTALPALSGRNKSSQPAPFPMLDQQRDIPCTPRCKAGGYDPNGFNNYWNTGGCVRAECPKKLRGQGYTCLCEPNYYVDQEPEYAHPQNTDWKLPTFCTGDSIQIRMAPTENYSPETAINIQLSHITSLGEWENTTYPGATFCPSRISKPKTNDVLVDGSAGDIPQYLCPSEFCSPEQDLPWNAGHGRLEERGNFWYLTLTLENTYVDHISAVQKVGSFQSVF